MTGRAWLRTAIVIAAGVVFEVGLTSPAAYSRAKKKEPTPTETPTPTATPTPEAKVWNFDQDKAHAMPEGWTAVEGEWEVIPDPSAPSQPNTYGLPAGRTMSSLHVEFPYIFRKIILHIMEHTAHHYAPGVPLYKLAAMQERIEQYGKSWRFSIRDYFEVCARCKLSLRTTAN
jgi:hypothetical protein